MFSFHQIIPRVKNQFPLGSSTKLDPQAQGFKEQVTEISKERPWRGLTVKAWAGHAAQPWV